MATHTEKTWKYLNILEQNYGTGLYCGKFGKMVFYQVYIFEFNKNMLECTWFQFTKEP